MTAAQEYAQRAYAVVHRRGSNHLALLLHGLGGDSKQPIGLTTDQLAGTGVDVLAPDARAHGETPVIGPAERFTTEALAEDVLALVDRLAFAGYRLIPDRHLDGRGGRTMACRGGARPAGRSTADPAGLRP
jgi:pimeloyl-ACP methyl ester carboxylesterase